MRLVADERAQQVERDAARHASHLVRLEVLRLRPRLSGADLPLPRPVRLVAPRRLLPAASLDPLLVVCDDRADLELALALPAEAQRGCLPLRLAAPPCAAQLAGPIGDQADLPHDSTNSKALPCPLFLAARRARHDPARVVREEHVWVRLLGHQPLEGKQQALLVRKGAQGERRHRPAHGW